MGAGLRPLEALLPFGAACRGVVPRDALLPAVVLVCERSTRSDSLLPGSTQVGPPFLYTPV